MNNPPASYEAFLREVLPMLDERLAASGTPVQDRPRTAACQIVDHFLVEVAGDTKDKYLLKPWFAGIFQPIHKWYERRYGQARSRSRKAAVRGVVAYFATPYLVHVPLVLNEHGKGGTAWVRFPCDVLPAENPLEWIEDPPPLEAVPSKRKASLLATVTGVATSLRAISNDLNTADYDQPEHGAMARSVIRHLEKAAADTVADDTATRSLAVWELQMACEKTIKAYLSQKQIAYPATHDLRVLQKLAIGAAEWTEAKQAMAAMPSERRVMAWRYAELPPPKPKELDRVYSATLRLCRLYAARLVRKHVFKNFAVQIRLPPWREEA